MSIPKTLESSVSAFITSELLVSAFTTAVVRYCLSHKLLILSSKTLEYFTTTTFVQGMLLPAPKVLIASVSTSITLELLISVIVESSVSTLQYWER